MTELTIIRNTFLLLFICCLFMACARDNDLSPQPEDILQVEEVVNELRLSVHGSVNTEDVDFEFDILGGNGQYAVNVLPEEGAKASIQGNKVKINLLSNSVSVTVSDKKQKSSSVSINSTSETLIKKNYGLFISSGNTSTMKHVIFGAGGYTIEKTKGTSAEVIVLEKDHIKVTGLKPGNSYYRIKDKRGSTALLEVMVTSTFDLTDSHMEIPAVNDQVVSIIIKRSNADWKLIGEPSSLIFEKVTIIPKGNTVKHDVLQIDTSKDNAKGIATVHLKDQAGNTASITVRIQ